MNWEQELKSVDAEYYVLVNEINDLKYQLNEKENYKKTLEKKLFEIKTALSYIKEVKGC